jgi:hypothetical protein
MSDNVIEKDWGYELIWSNNENYQGRILFFNKPGKTDMHMHKNATKSWFVNDGEFNIRWIDTENGKVFMNTIKEGAVFHVNKHMPVSAECISNQGSIMEVSDRSDEDYLCLLPATNF